MVNFSVKTVAAIKTFNAILVEDKKHILAGIVAEKEANTVILVVATAANIVIHVVAQEELNADIVQVMDIRLAINVMETKQFKKGINAAIAMEADK